MGVHNHFIMNSKIFAVLFLAAAAHAAPTADADADADPQLLLGGAHLGAAPLAAAPVVAGHAAVPVVATHAAAPVVAAPVVAATAPNCKVENEILVTKSCVPTAENVCTKELVETEEIEYEKVCKDVIDTICDAPAPAIAHIVKREAEADADADADAQILGYGPGLAAPYAAAAPIAHVAPVAPVAHAVAHSAVTTVKHPCHEVTTQHCVNNPKVKIVPVEVEHCHTVTKVTCSDIENPIPKTTCEPVETTHVAGYALPGLLH